jgi:hypothetical protein
VRRRGGRELCDEGKKNAPQVDKPAKKPSDVVALGGGRRS